MTVSIPDLCLLTRLASDHYNAYNYIYNYILARKNHLIKILSFDMSEPRTTPNKV